MPQIDINYQMIRFNTADSLCIEIRNSWYEITRTSWISLKKKLENLRRTSNFE